ncbi:MAG: FecR domain-containing protein [Spirochaetales bacterium]|nr:FecR domain-containing protein [Spirochaetales bacterium]
MRNRAVFLFFLIALTVSPANPIVIQKGETIDTFSRKYLSDPRKWRDVLRANKLTEKDFKPGVRIEIPRDVLRRGDAMVVNMQRRAEYSRSHSEDWLSAVTGLMLYAQDRVKTDTQGALQLAFRNQAQVTVRPGTELILNIEGSDGLFLKEGRIRSVLKEKAAFSVTTPAAIASVRGTDFETEVSKSGSTTVSCFAGSVDVTAQGRTVNLPAGHTLNVEPGKPPAAPQKLPPPPARKIQ